MSDEVPGLGDRPAPADDPLRERLVSSEVLRRSRILEFRIDTIEAADGHRSTRDIAGHPGGVCVVAIDGQDRVLLVRQWRHAAGQALLEIPAGTLDRHPDGGIEGHSGAAARELEEETGSRAGTWQYLGAFYTAPGFTSELMHLYLATDLEAVREGGLAPDEDERLELWPVNFDEALGSAERGQIPDAKTIVGLFWVARIRERQLHRQLANMASWLPPGVGPSPEHVRLIEMMEIQPLAAWDDFKSWVASGAPSYEARAILEEFVSRHGAALIDDIEAEVALNSKLAETVAFANVDDSFGPAIPRFQALQERLRDSLDAQS